MNFLNELGILIFNEPFKEGRGHAVAVRVLRTFGIDAPRVARTRLRHEIADPVRHTFHRPDFANARIRLRDVRRLVDH